MIYRVVLAVALATALVAATMPALADARRERASAVVADQAESLERIGKRLVATEDPVETAGARRLVAFRLPARQWSSARVDRVAIRPARDDGPARIDLRVAGGRTGTHAMLGVPLGTPDGRPLVLRTTGRHRLVLSLDGRRGAPRVTVRRLK